MPVGAALDWPGTVQEAATQALNSPFRRFPGATAAAALLVAEFRLPGDRVDQKIVGDLGALVAQRDVDRRALAQVGGVGVDSVGAIQQHRRRAVERAGRVQRSAVRQGAVG